MERPEQQEIIHLSLPLQSVFKAIDASGYAGFYQSLTEVEQIAKFAASKS